MNNTQKARFAPGAITITTGARTAAAQANQTLVAYLRRHLTADFGSISAEQAGANDQVLAAGKSAIPLHDDIQSCYRLASGRELVITTHYVHTPALRWTDICLVGELVSGQTDDDTLAFGDEVGLALRDDEDSAPDDGPALPAAANLTEIELTLADLRPGPWQNRRTFDRQRLAELAASLRQDGLLNPPLVAPGDDHYLLIAGERRWRALCALAVAGRGTVSLEEMLDVAAAADGPVRLLARWQDILAGVTLPVRLDTSGDPARCHRLALIDNIQRQDLDPIEEAAGYLALMQEYGYSRREVARRVGRSSNHVTGRLLLLELEEPVRALIAVGDFPRSAEVAKALLALPTTEARIEFARHHAARRSANKLIIKAAAGLREKLSANQGTELAGPPLLALGLGQRSAPTGSILRPALRQAAHQMCTGCPVNRTELDHWPEPAWDLLRAEATFVCSQCPSQHIERVCRRCPGVALLQALITEVA